MLADDRPLRRPARSPSSIGDYVLAHAYLRDDHVLDDVLPPEIPDPADRRGAGGAAARGRAWSPASRRGARSGACAPAPSSPPTTATGSCASPKTRKRFNQSRAIAIDMESATHRGQGYRLRVPYGMLLCVSDKPLHGEIKLPGHGQPPSTSRAIGEHLQSASRPSTSCASRGRRRCTRASSAASTSRRSGEGPSAKRRRRAGIVSGQIRIDTD